MKDTDVNTIYDETFSYIKRHLYLVEELESRSEYIQYCAALEGLSPEDHVVLHINNGGGSIAVMSMLTNAMSKCQAKITGCLEYDAHSAASVLFLLCDDWEVGHLATMHLHNGYFLAGGDKAHEVILNATFTHNGMKKLYQMAYKGFLTDEEITQLEDGKDFRLDSDEIIERLGNLKSYRESKNTEGGGDIQVIPLENDNYLQVEGEDITLVVNTTSWGEIGLGVSEQGLSPYTNDFLFEVANILDCDTGEGLVADIIDYCTSKIEN